PDPRARTHSDEPSSSHRDSSRGRAPASRPLASTRAAEAPASQRAKGASGASGASEARAGESRESPGAGGSEGEGAAHRDGERERIVEALTRCNWNRVKAAKLIGLPRRTFYRRLKEYGIQ